MPRHVSVESMALRDYVPLVGAEAIDELYELASALRGLRLLVLNSTPSGGGVAVVLRSIVPALRALGIEADWYAMDADRPFFETTKLLHNLLQGGSGALSSEQCEVYERVNQANAAALPPDYDLYMVHDPQPAAVRRYTPSARVPWVWRCHVDTSEPSPAAWDYLRGFIQEYDAAMFTLAEFVSADLQLPHLCCFPLAIDPLQPVNAELPEPEARRLVAGRGIAWDRPLVGQFSRFDPWKDPSGVIEVYRLVRQEVPGLQLVLNGPAPEDDPEAEEVYRQTQAAATADPDIHVLLESTPQEVNALQRACDVVVQKSLREGFGLVVSEALWKRRPVVGSDVGGIRFQLADSLSEFVVPDINRCAEQVAYLIEHPKLRSEVGEVGHRHVREHFLLPRLVRDNLTFLAQVIGV